MVLFIGSWAIVLIGVLLMRGAKRTEDRFTWGVVIATVGAVCVAFALIQKMFGAMIANLIDW